LRVGWFQIRRGLRSGSTPFSKDGAQRKYPDGRAFFSFSLEPATFILNLVAAGISFSKNRHINCFTINSMLPRQILTDFAVQQKVNSGGDDSSRPQFAGPADLTFQVV
jgi:hypothetical protein